MVGPVLLLITDRVVVLFLQYGELLHHTLGDTLGARLTIEVVELVGVVLQVVQLPRVDVIVEVDELVTAITDTIVALH